MEKEKNSTQLYNNIANNIKSIRKEADEIRIKIQDFINSDAINTFEKKINEKNEEEKYIKEIEELKKHSQNGQFQAELFNEFKNLYLYIYYFIIKGLSS